MPILKDRTHAKSTGRQRQQHGPAGPDGGLLRLAVPGAAVVVTLGLFGYALVAGTAMDQTRTRSAGSAAKTNPFAPAEGWINNLAALSSVLGRAAPSEWQGGNGQPFAAAPPAGRLPQFAAASMMLSGTADGRLAFATRAAGRSQVAADEANSESELSSLSIEFPGNSAKISAAGVGALKKAAQLMKALPAGTEVEVIGYTVGSGSSHHASVLAQRRANSVYTALVRLGVHPSILRPLAATNAELEANAKSATEGRSSTEAGASQRRDRRVAFHVIETQR